MKKFALVTTTTFLFALATGSAFAGTRDPGVNARQHDQHHRIHQGVKSGELTRPEARALRQQQQAIRAEERSYKADGQLTGAERKDLRQDLRKASRDIYTQKHDAERRGN